MNTVFTLIQNANSLDIDICRLLAYMAVVCKYSDIDPDKIVEGFSLMLERVNNIWGNDDNEDWQNIKSIASKYDIILIDDDGNLLSFDTVLRILIRRYFRLSIFGKSEFITALAGENKRNMLLDLVENYCNKVDYSDGIVTMASTMLQLVYNNQNGVTNNG